MNIQIQRSIGSSQCCFQMKVEMLFSWLKPTAFVSQMFYKYHRPLRYSPSPLDNAQIYALDLLSNAVFTIITHQQLLNNFTLFIHLFYKSFILHLQIFYQLMCNYTSESPWALDKLEKGHGLMPGLALNSDRNLIE